MSALDEARKEAAALPGLKERDLSPCLCGKPLGISFYRVTVERFLADTGAVQRRVGLGMMLGGSGAIARAMGPDEDLAKQIGSTAAFLCLACALERHYATVGLLEGE